MPRLFRTPFGLSEKLSRALALSALGLAFFAGHCVANEALLGHWTVDTVGFEKAVDRGPLDLDPEMKGSARIHQGEGWQAIAFGPAWGQLEVPESSAINRAVSGFAFTARILVEELPKGGAATIVTKRKNWYESSPDSDWKQFVNNGWTNRGQQRVLIILFPGEDEDDPPEMFVRANRPESFGGD